MSGERSTIQTNLSGTKMAFPFDKYTLREVEITSGNTFEHALQALAESLGEPNVSKINLAVWDRRDGARFTVTSRKGIGVLFVVLTHYNAISRSVPRRTLQLKDECRQFLINGVGSTGRCNTL